MASAEHLGVEDVAEVLTDVFGLEGDTSRGEFRTLCPVHEAGETGHHPSVDVNLTSGYWNCFSCPAAGDIVDLGCVVLEDVPFVYKLSKAKDDKRQWFAARKKVKKLLEPSDPTAIQAGVRRRLRSHRRNFRQAVGTKTRFQPIVPPVDAYTFKFPKYLKDRGFTEETLRRWNIRYAKDVTLMKEDGKSFTLTEAICIPIINELDKVVAWCYRATEKSEEWFRNVRYIYTPGTTDTLSSLWFGMHLHKDAAEVAICEGALDAIWCDQMGVPALAILGSQVKQLPKIRSLMRFKRVVIFCDRDTSGMTTTLHLGAALQERGIPVRVCRYPTWMLSRQGKPAKDAQDLCGVDLELVYERSVPFILWKRGLRIPETNN